MDGKPHAVMHINGLRVASYDQNGNMTARTESATYAQTFDIENRLTDVNGVRFAYDADGTLIKKVDGSKTTTYVGNYFEKEQAQVFVPNTQKSFGSSWKIENFALPGGKTRKYYYFGRQRIAVRENNAAPQWIHGYHLGSASITTDNTGAKVGEMRYTPFGEFRVDTGDAKGNKRFQGAERVTSIELDSMGARFYSAGLGRFISADTIVPGARNPQSFNRYSFVLNNPLRFTDPSGHAQVTNEGNPSVRVLFDREQQGLFERCYMTSCFGYALVNFLKNNPGYDIAGDPTTNPAEQAQLTMAQWQMWQDNGTPINPQGVFAAIAIVGVAAAESGEIQPQTVRGEGSPPSLRLTTTPYEEIGTASLFGPPNPGGRLGGPNHRSKVIEINDWLTNRGIPADRIVPEYEVKTPGGVKSKRYADLAVLDVNQNPTEFHQIGVLNKNGTPVAREQYAINDIFDETGVATVFWPYRIR